MLALFAPSRASRSIAAGPVDWVRCELRCWLSFAPIPRIAQHRPSRPWITVVNGVASEHYVYSTQNGNRITGNTPQRNVPAAQISYDTQDRLRTYAPYTYTYTNNGELQTKTDSTTSQTQTYAYDARGNLLSVATQGGTTISYVVDGMNRRVAKKITIGAAATVIRQWLYRDSLKPVAELDAAGNLISTFVYASNQNTPDFMVHGGKTYRILTDHVGSPRLVGERGERERCAVSSKLHGIWRGGDRRDGGLFAVWVCWWVV